MKSDKLTVTQQEIYDSIKTDDWFSYHDIETKFDNRDSQCRKIKDKGYFEIRLKPGTNTMNLGINYVQFRKVKKC
jgi:hypothetical protein